MYEVHIAIPKTNNPHILKQVSAQLQNAGIEKTKYFLNVVNLDGPFSRPETPPTGHDLEHPAAMATVKTSDVGKVIEYVRSGMQTLRDFELQGNFEVECWAHDDPVGFNPAVQLAEFIPVPDSPSFENHIVWKGSKADIPSYDSLSKTIHNIYGYQPHQIVDFSRENNYDGTISRVATIYQPSKEAALACEAILEKSLDQLKCKYAIAEQVLLVGKWPESPLTTSRL